MEQRLRPPEYPSVMFRYLWSRTIKNSAKYYKIGAYFGKLYTMQQCL